MSSKRIWLAILLILFVSSLFGTYWIYAQKTNSRIADIYLHGQVVKSIDLAKVKNPYFFRIDTGNGQWNEILVKPGEIEITKANCPDQVCVHHKPIGTGIEPIVCLPHQLVIRIRDDDTVISPHQHDHSDHIDGVAK